MGTTSSSWSAEAPDVYKRQDHDSYRRMIRRAVKEFGFKAAATTLRVARTATLNDWAAMLARWNMSSRSWRVFLKLLFDFFL